MLKFRLNKGSREVILSWMEETKIKQCQERVDFLEVMEKSIREVNKVLRKKFPEDDMVVLRKYGLTRIDTCLRFSIEGGMIFAFDVGYVNYEDFTEIARKSLMDIPHRAGCNNNQIFEGNEKLAVLLEALNDRKVIFQKFCTSKWNQYSSFVNTCKYIEDVELIVPLPEELRTRLTGSRNAIVAINPEIVASIENDFKDTQSKTKRGNTKKS